MRSLSPEEAELWAKVAATIRPQARSGNEDPRRYGEGNHPKVPPPRRINAGPPPPSAAGTVLLPVPGRIGLDGSWEKKLRGGSVEPDRVLDLHGMNLDAAWHAIDRALDQAIARRDRVILLITGHDRPDPNRGRIRAAVHDWLAASRHAADIAAVRQAHRRHGGGGSLYLIVRRQRSPR